ncbi:MAG: hypothetical protein EA397_18325 [Deltaproteobacteria bacterium]|nr:MAG: hypothetical protein EA397_18325 [Deltaproteobacteria bacterium]
MTLDEERNFLRYLRFDDGVYRNAEAGETFGFGPFGAGAGGEEASMDLLVGEEAWAWYPGAWVDGDEGGWTLPLPEGEAFPLSIAGAMYTADDGRGLTFVEAGTALRAGWIEVDALGPVVSELVSVGTVEQEILDAAVCGDRVWVLFEDELVLARLGDDVLGRREVHSPLAVACRAERGAVLDDAGISVLDDALDVLTTEEAAGALGIALYDDEVERCQGRCRLWSSGGAVVVAEALGDEVLVRDLDGEALLALPGGGADLSLGAVAGDGEVDLLWRWGRGFVGAARLVDGQVGVIGSVHVPASVSGPPVAIGGELWFRDHGALRGPPLAD